MGSCVGVLSALEKIRLEVDRAFIYWRAVEIAKVAASPFPIALKFRRSSPCALPILQGVWSHQRGRVPDARAGVDRSTWRNRCDASWLTNRPLLASLPNARYGAAVSVEKKIDADQRPAG